MKYIKSFNENKLKFYTNKAIIWVFNTFFRKMMNKRMEMYNTELYHAGNRLMDKRVDLPNMIIGENTELYDYLINNYNKYYNNNNIIDDCNILQKELQKNLWTDKNNTQVYANAIHSMDKFIEYAKNVNK